VAQTLAKIFMVTNPRLVIDAQKYGAINLFAKVLLA